MKRFLFIVTGLLIISQFELRAQESLVASTGSVITVESGAGLFITGGIEMQKNSTLYNDGSIAISKTSTAAADFTDHNDKVYSYGTGKFIFAGTGSQNIFSVNRFGLIEVNNSGLNLMSDIRANNWYLKSGKVTTGNFYAIVSGTDEDAIQAGISNSRFSLSWINGNLRRYINPVAFNRYLFPVGDDAKVNMAELDNLSYKPLTGLQYVDASFGAKPGNDAGLNIRTANRYCASVSNGGVWRLVTDAVPSGGNFDLKLFVDGFKGLENKELGILQRPADSYMASAWTLPAGNSLFAADRLGRYISENNLSKFGQFGVGIISMVTPVTSYVKDASLKVYPNPVIDNQFYVEYNGIKVNAVKLLAADGKTVACNFKIQKSNQLKVSLPVFMAKGIYTLQLDTDNGLQSTKINLQ